VVPNWKMEAQKSIKYFKAFFAVSSKEIRETVVISPIVYPKQFEKIYGEKGKHYKSILSYLIVNFKDLTFVKTPMTQAAVYDLVVLLKGTPCKKVIFIGAMGGLAKGLKIGDVVETKKVYSVSSIHEETRKKLLSLKKKGIVGIDFEAQFFFRAAKKSKLTAKAYFVVTDLPLSKPFYIKKSKKEEIRIKEALSRVVRRDR
jgi:purine-nucleoside phosphorylase